VVLDRQRIEAGTAGLPPTELDAAWDSAAAPATPATIAAFARAIERVSFEEETARPSSLLTARGERVAAPVAPVLTALHSPGGPLRQSVTLGPPSPGQHVPDEGALEHQIVRAIRLQWQGGIGQATIRLQPEHLGSLVVSLRVDGGVVSASVRAETPAVEQWISANERDLRSGLERQGLTLDRLVVNPDGHERRHSARDERRSPGPRARGRRGGSMPTFEVAA
jgi:flagellar hook-length control protein FliK